MNEIKQIIRLRHQSDEVKIITIYMLIAVFCLISSLGKGIELYKTVNSAVSYEFVCSGVSGLSNVIENNKNIVTGTPQKVNYLQMSVGGESFEIETRSLSKEYLQEEMQVQKFQSNLFYGNKKAMDILCAAKDTGVVKYSSENEDGSVSTKNGQVIDLPKDDGEDNPIMYCCGTIKELKEATESVLILSNYDLDGSITAYLSEEGYSLKDTQKVSDEKAQLNEAIITVKYRMIIMLICLVSSGVLWKNCKK